MSAQWALRGRYCCKSRFAQVIKNSAGCRRVFGVKMWGDRFSRVKLTSDFGNAIEAIRTIVCRFLFSRKIRGVATFDFCNTIGLKPTLGLDLSNPAVLAFEANAGAGMISSLRNQVAR